MNSNGDCQYSIVDAFPATRGPHFRHTAGAIIGCWVPAAPIDLDSKVRKQLEADGWEIAATIERRIVSRTTYTKKSDGRKEYEAALEHGFGAHVHHILRETMTLPGSEFDEAATSARSFAEFASVLARSAWSFLDGDDGQWANGATPNGNDFLPLWSTEEVAAQWQAHWPGFKLTRLGPHDLVGDDGLLARVHESDLWIAAGIGSSLILTHPIHLARDMESMRSPDQ